MQWSLPASSRRQRQGSDGGVPAAFRHHAHGVWRRRGPQSGDPTYYAAIRPTATRVPAGVANVTGLRVDDVSRATVFRQPD